MTRQAVQLGYSPRVEIRHTSHTTIGQIYIPTVNWALMIGTIALVLLFQSSSGAGRGLRHRDHRDDDASRRCWPTWSRATCGAGAGGPPVRSPPCCSSSTRRFSASNAAEDPARRLGAAGHGGVRLPADVDVEDAAGRSWARGCARRRIRSDQFLKELPRTHPDRVPGSAIFMTGSGAGVPPTLLHNLRHNKVLHASVVLLTVVTEEIPEVPDARRVEIEPLGSGFFRVTLRYGFVEEPDVPAAIALARGRGLPIDKDDITYFLGRETLLAAANDSGMAQWREALFSLMSKNAMRATAFFRIPPERVVELGMHVEL